METKKMRSVLNIFGHHGSAAFFLPISNPFILIIKDGDFFEQNPRVALTISALFVIATIEAYLFPFLTLIQDNCGNNFS